MLRRAILATSVFLPIRRSSGQTLMLCGLFCVSGGLHRRKAEEPLPLDQPDQKATTFITSHFYLTLCNQARAPTRSFCTGNSRERPRTRTWPGCATQRKPLWQEQPCLRLQGQRANKTDRARPPSRTVANVDVAHNLPDAQALIEAVEPKRL